MNSSGYWDAMRRPTEKQYDDRVKRPHSDDKKPYMEDEYPEMEYFWTPYDPPNFVPPGIPDDPRIPPNVPDNPSTGTPGDEEIGEPEFTGCIFGVPRGPLVIGPGETTFSGIGLLPSDPLRRLYVNYGPVSLLTDVQTVNNCISSLAPNCIVSAQALEGVDPDDYHVIGDYMIAQVVGQTYAGFECAWDILVKICPPEIEFAYDDENNATILNDGESTPIYVLGGSPPFDWVLSGGEDWSLAYSRTNGRTNILYAGQNVCGTANLTITDGCDDQVLGYVRANNGQWQGTGEYWCSCKTGAGGCCQAYACVVHPFRYPIFGSDRCEIDGQPSFCAWSGG